MKTLNFLLYFHFYLCIFSASTSLKQTYFLNCARFNFIVTRSVCSYLLLKIFRNIVSVHPSPMRIRKPFDGWLQVKSLCACHKFCTLKQKRIVSEINKRNHGKNLRDSNAIIRQHFFKKLAVMNYYERHIPPRSIEKLKNASLN